MGDELLIIDKLLFESWIALNCQLIEAPIEIIQELKAVMERLFFDNLIFMPFLFFSFNPPLWG